MTAKKQPDQVPLQKKMDDVTVCAKCDWCRPAMDRRGKNQLAYAKCAATVKHLLDTVNVVTGKIISKVPKMECCSVKNHGDCIDFVEKKKVRGVSTGWVDGFTKTIKTFFGRIKFE